MGWKVILPQITEYFYSDIIVNKEHCFINTTIILLNKIQSSGHYTQLRKIILH